MLCTARTEDDAARSISCTAGLDGDGARSMFCTPGLEGDGARSMFCTPSLGGDSDLQRSTGFGVAVLVEAPNESDGSMPHISISFWSMKSFSPGFGDVEIDMPGTGKRAPSALATLKGSVAIEGPKEKQPAKLEFEGAPGRSHGGLLKEACGDPALCDEGVRDGGASLLKESCGDPALLRDAGGVSLFSEPCGDPGMRDDGSGYSGASLPNEPCGDPDLRDGGGAP